MPAVRGSSPGANYRAREQRVGTVVTPTIVNAMLRARTSRIAAHRAFAGALVLCLGGACTSPDEGGNDDIGGGDITERARVIEFGYCPPHLCGLNSDLAGAISFHTKGDVANAGMRLVSVLAPDGQQHPLRVIRDGLEIDPPQGQGEIISGTDLIGSTFVFEHDDDGRQTFVYLDDVTPGALQTYNNPGVAYAAYSFTYRDEDEAEDVRHPLCGEFPWDENYEIGQIVSTDALVIQSEAYDWHGRGVEEPGDSFQWATLGCIGGAYAKKVLMGYDPHHPAPGNTSLPENETMLRMLTARYCDGENHTEPGTPIRWENDRGWSSLHQDDEVVVEAIWNEEGVVCLDEPRFVDRADVEAECGAIPRCDGFDPGQYHLTSYRVVG